MEQSKPLVSIIIPVLNEEKNIRDCLISLKKQSYPNIELIVVDNGSVDATLQIAAECGAHKIIHQNHPGITYAKNSGIREASGELIATTDADCEADSLWIETLVTSFTGPSIASCGGANLVPPNSTDFEKCVDNLLNSLGGISGSKYISHKQLLSETNHNPGCNVMYRRLVLQELGGFNERLLTVEDEELDFRILKKGYKILYNPGAKVYHKRRSDGKKFFKQMYRYAIGRTQFFLSAPRLSQWPRFMPSALLLGNALLFTSLFFYPSMIPALQWEITAGLGGWFILACVLATKTQKKYFAFYMQLIFILFFAWAIGSLRGISYKQS